MSNTVGAIDISSMPELRDLVKEVEETKQPKALTRDNRVVAVLIPVMQGRAKEREEIPNERAVALMKEAEKDFKAGRFRSFNSEQEAAEYVRSLIKDEKYKHRQQTR
jgi:hypothetical protein